MRKCNISQQYNVFDVVMKGQQLTVSAIHNVGGLVGKPHFELVQVHTFSIIIPLDEARDAHRENTKLGRCWGTWQGRPRKIKPTSFALTDGGGLFCDGTALTNAGTTVLSSACRTQSAASLNMSASHEDKSNDQNQTSVLPIMLTYFGESLKR